MLRAGDREGEACWGADGGDPRSARHGDAMVTVSKPAFLDLSVAVDFIARALESDDYDTLADACVEERPAAPGLPTPREHRLRAIKVLAERHRGGSLRSLYTGRVFPAQDTCLKLGGHDRELGHVHIDFARSELGWRLIDIWICR